MDWEKKALEWNRLGVPQTTQILLEGDIIVSDNKPDISEILCYDGKIVLADKRVMEDRVSLSGELAIHMLYMGKGAEEAVYALDGVLPLEDVVYVDGLHKDMSVEVVGSIVHLECRVINDRKLGVKCIVSFVATPKEACITEIVQGGNELAFLEKTITIMDGQKEMEERFTVKEEIALAQTLPEVGEVLRVELHLVEKEVRPQESKVMVRATMELSVLYGDPLGMVYHFVEKVPFQGYLENEKMTAKTMTDGTLIVEDVTIKPLVNEDGECRLLSLFATIKAHVVPLDLEERRVVMDAYAPQMETILQKERIAYPKHVALGKNQFHMKETIALEGKEMPLMQLEGFWGDVVLEHVKSNQDTLEVDGILMVELLYHSAKDGKLATAQRGFPFTQKMEMKGVLPEDMANCRCSLENLDVQSLSEKESEVVAQILLEGVVVAEEFVDVVTDVSCTPKEAVLGEMAGAIIYQTQNGDSLWSVAKRYGTTMEHIRKVNEMTREELAPNQKILILKEGSLQPQMAKG